MLGVPVSLGALSLAALERGSIALDASDLSGDTAPPRALWISVLALVAATSIGYQAIDLTLTSAVSASAIVLVALWFTSFERLPRREVVTVVRDHVDRTWAGASPEVALFLCSGLFATALWGVHW